MNYLAHAYLSFNDEPVMVGNLISDFVKGKKKFLYPDRIQKGITLHRAIDEFTDEHPVTKMAKNIFRPAYRLYSGAFVDVAFDHFLANDHTEFTEESLQQFSATVYTTLDHYSDYWPERFARMFPYMKIQDWLFNYRTRWGTESSFGGLVRRARYLTESNTASRLFHEHYSALHECYKSFFPEVKSFARHMYQDMIKI
jgi:acyl carrier protein phosphodiesterase